MSTEIKNNTTNSALFSKEANRKDKDWHWTYSCTLFGIFGGVIALAFFGKYTLISFIELTKFLSFFCLVGLLIPMKIWEKYLGIKNVEVIMFNILGIGPIVVSALLILNFSFRQKEETKTYAVEHFEREYTFFQDYPVILYTLENNIYHDQPNCRSMEIKPGDVITSPAKYIKITTAKGFLGYDVFILNEALYE